MTAKIVNYSELAPNQEYYLTKCETEEASYKGIDRPMAPTAKVVIYVRKISTK